MELAVSIFLVMIALLVIVTLAKTIKIIPQARSGIVERFGRYKKTLSPGLNFLTPWIEKVRYVIDMREQVVSFPPQPVITEDNLVVSIDTVIYFQVTNPVTATYEIANYIQAIEQLTMTTLRQITGGMTLEHALTGRDQINGSLRGVLDEATGRWGIRVNRVELKGIDPPPSIKDAMEKQMRAERDKRAAILTAEGERQSAILTAEGDKQSSILSAEGDREAAILRAQAEREASILKAQGEGQAIQTVFQAIHDGSPDQSLLAYQYLQMMPKIAEGDANKVWIVPSEIGKALEGLGHAVGAIPDETDGPQKRVSFDQSAAETSDERLSETHDAVAEAIADARSASVPGGGKKARANQEEPPSNPPPGRTPPQPGQGQAGGAPNPAAQQPGAQPPGSQRPGDGPPRQQPPSGQPPQQQPPGDQ